MREQCIFALLKEETATDQQRPASPTLSCGDAVAREMEKGKVPRPTLKTDFVFRTKKAKVVTFHLK